MTTNNNNKMKTYYIGTRAKWNDIGDVLGRDDVARLNQGLSKSIRTSVMKSGIKKTEQGARLEFYSVSNDEFDKLMKEQDTRVRPLVRVDEELLNKTLTDVNKLEILMLGVLAFFVIFFGFYPMPLFETFSFSVNSLIDNYQLALNTR